jgi:hypothetical protein
VFSGSEAAPWGIIFDAKERPFMSMLDWLFYPSDHGVLDLDFKGTFRQITQLAIRNAL